MNKSISTALIIVGIGLIVYGLIAMESFSSDVSRLFTGAPTDKAMWMLIVGVIATAVGSSGAVFGSRSPKG